MISTRIAPTGNAVAERWHHEWLPLRIASLVMRMSVGISDARLRARARPVNLGRMSERWLMEYRMSNSK